ncbi:MAG: cytochrome c [Acidobacteria bacterium]|nr:MAG: cytochrome c [Acidobacteriota bacterium]REK04273.1 MAG: cytochrome c [Acidobacteriota bacterium]
MVARVLASVSALVVTATVASPTLAASAAAAIELPEQVTYSEHVAPVLHANCVSCHRPGDVAPMSLLSYGEARPWARTIARAVGNREMPPWDGHSDVATFSNDTSLSERDIALIQRWVEQGAQQGDPSATPPLPELPEAGSWRMGREPDLVVELAPVDVPADGPDLFVTQVYGVEIPEDVWLSAIELLPGNNEVLHHVVTYLGPFGIADEDDEIDSNAGVRSTIFLNDAAKREIRFNEAPRLGGVWVAGSPPTEFREGTGQPLSKNEIISLNMHYHPSGNAGTDGSKLGLYFGEGELQKQITTAFAADPGILIPAGAGDHHEKALYYFAQDSQILSLLPHMHQRGKSMRYTVVKPDGTREVLLDVPEYDYDWQNIYYLEQPYPVAAGTILEVDATWDNSPENPVNPDASLDIPWGDGTNYEMLVAFVDFIVDDGKAPQRQRVNPIIDTLLDRHAADRAYSLSVEGMGFGGNWGLVLPEDASGEGTFYMVFGSLMFSASVPDLQQLAGDQMIFNGSIITSGGGTQSPLGFLARRTEDGIAGEVFFGRKVTAENVEQLRGTGRTFEGTSRAAALAAPPGESPSAGR